MQACNSNCRLSVVIVIVLGLRHYFSRMFCCSTKKHFRESYSIPPKTHWPSTCPRWYFLFPIRGACKRMGLVTNGQTVTPRIPNRNFPKFFVNGKRPECMGLRIRECLREVGNPGSIRVMASLQVLEIIWSQRENHKGYIGLRVRWGITGEIEFRGRLAIGQREVGNHRKY